MNRCLEKEVNKKKEDIKIICKDCGEEFLFTVGEQNFYEEKGFQNKPVRCKACRDKKKAEKANYARDERRD